MNLEGINLGRQKQAKKKREFILKFISQRPNQQVTEKELLMFYREAFGQSYPTYQMDINLLVKEGLLKKTKTTHYKFVPPMYETTPEMNPMKPEFSNNQELSLDETQINRVFEIKEKENQQQQETEQNRG
jgi:hypothetical protein